MWEIIQGNKRKSLLLFLCMGLFLVFLGYLIGAVFFPPQGGLGGAIIAVCVWMLMSVISYSAGDSLLLSLSNAHEVTHDVHPQLFNIVEEMKIAANLPSMPKVYIIPETAPNAFATGIRPDKSAIVVTAGLLSRLNRDQLQGVVAHEMSHITNRDVLFMTFAGVMLGSIVLVSEVFLRSMWFSGGSSRRYRSGSSSKGGGQGQLILVVAAVVLAILSPIIARLMYFAMSRKREYLADACAVRLTRYPEGLASALETIAGTGVELASANKVTAPMYIINPLGYKSMAVSELSSTHPPTSERIAILRSMHQGVNYAEYQKAFSNFSKTRVVPPSALKDTEAVSIRKASQEEPKKKNSKETVREVGDLIRAVNNYAFIACVCGLKIKVPPDFKEHSLSCPRCGRRHEIPLGDLRSAGAILGSMTAMAEADKKGTISAEEQQVYTKKSGGWETFSCRCGRPVQLSPHFAASHATCGTCGRKIIVR
jgi:heat shock protein HtpX